MEIKFVSWSGKYPNLCSGTLKFRIRGKLYTLSGCFLLESGGTAGFDEDWNAHVSQGPWSISSDKLPSELLPFQEEIEEMINENIPQGCCGGCL